MSKKNNRTCFACGKGYYFCPNCNENYINPKPSWYGLFDCEQCLDVFHALVEHTSGRLTDEQVKTALAKYDMTDLDKYCSESSAKLKKIYLKKPNTTGSATKNHKESKNNNKIDFDKTSEMQ